MILRLNISFWLSSLNFTVEKDLQGHKIIKNNFLDFYLKRDLQLILEDLKKFDNY